MPPQKIGEYAAWLYCARCGQHWRWNSTTHVAANGWVDFSYLDSTDIDPEYPVPRLMCPECRNKEAGPQ